MVLVLYSLPMINQMAPPNITTDLMLDELCYNREVGQS